VLKNNSGNGVLPQRSCINAKLASRQALSSLTPLLQRIARSRFSASFGKYLQGKSVAATRNNNGSDPGHPSRAVAAREPFGQQAYSGAVPEH
jgi:hypothetical protein